MCKRKGKAGVRGVYSHSVAVCLMPHFHDLHHVQVNWLIGPADSQHCIDDSLCARQGWSVRASKQH